MSLSGLGAVRFAGIMPVATGPIIMRRKECGDSRRRGSASDELVRCHLVVYFHFGSTSPFLFRHVWHDKYFLFFSLSFYIHTCQPAWTIVVAVLYIHFK